MDEACVTWLDKFSNERLRDKTFAVNHCIFVYFPLLLRLKSTISRNAGIGLLHHGTSLIHFFLKKRLSLVRDGWYTKFCL